MSLRVFLGYAPGTGKTTAMLAAARARQQQGTRVLVGLVKTDQPIDDLPRLGDFDLDACLRAELVVIDDLAGASRAGGRHLKRYQDVEELLAAGTEVYTTLDIQNVESLKDAVWRITGQRAADSVPDRVLRGAVFELVDRPGQNGQQTALRELTLHYLANRLDDEVVAYMRERALPGPWPVRERLLVAVGPSPLSERLIRAASRLAESLRAEWLAVSVEGGEAYTPDARERVAAHLRLAASLGAHSEQVTGNNVAVRLVEYAREHNVTQIVAGKPLKRRWWSRDLVDQLLQCCGAIDVHVVSADSSLEPPPVSRPSPAAHWAYGLSTLAVALMSLLMGRFLTPIDLVLAYLGLVSMLAFWLGRGPALWASVLSLAVFDFCFVPPYYTFDVSEREYFVTFGALLVVSWIISTLTGRAREQAQMARLREGQTIALLDLSRDLSSGRSGEELAGALEGHLQRRVDGEARVRLEPADEVAGWAWAHGRPAGRGTDTMSEAGATYLPVVGTQGTLAVVVLKRLGPLSLPEQELLDSFLQQAAVALERLRLASLAQQAEVLQTTERLQTALINSVSHDLRIPLVSIVGALQAIQSEAESPLPESNRRSLVDNALAEADRLNRIVGNLLQMSQLDSGVLRIQGQPQDLHDLLAMFSVQELHLPETLPLVHCDFLLTQQVLLNLLDNARKYAPGLPVEVGAEEQGKFVMLYVQDQGPGIPEGEREKVFGRFYRARNSRSESGTGLGLSICQGLIEAQGGRIWLESPGVGTRVCFTLPVALPK